MAVASSSQEKEYKSENKSDGVSAASRFIASSSVDEVLLMD